MSATDIRAVVKKWSKRDKKLALAVLLREFAQGAGTMPVVIEGESNQAMGLFYPIEYTVEDLDINADTPEMRELKQLVENREVTVSHEELLALLHEDDAVAVFR